MLDFACVNFPFKNEYVSADAEGRYMFINVDPHELDIPLASRSVYKDDDGNINAGILFHPYESLPTHYTAMAMKVFFDSSYAPYVQLKASPAKIMQGHNVFGSDNIEAGIFEMLGYMYTAYPHLTKMLDVPEAWVSYIDVTYSAKLKDQHTARKVIDFMRNVHNKQTRQSKKTFDTSVYWGGETSRLLQQKCYLKHDEFMAQFEDMQQRAKKNDKSAQRVVNVMSDERLINWTNGLLRFETRLKKRWLERNGIPTRVRDLVHHQKKNPDFLQTLWTKANANIFEALKGQNMNFTDDKSVLKAIETSPVVITKSGRISHTKVRNLMAMYILIREKGIQELKETYSKTSFHRLVSELCECGFSKAFLQNLHIESSKNVIPFIKMVEIDFNQQIPEWYVPPVSQFKVA